MMDYHAILPMAELEKYRKILKAENQMRIGTAELEPL